MRYGWLCLAELNMTNSLLRSYLWGLDLSGSLSGAGGVVYSCELIRGGKSEVNREERDG